MNPYQILGIASNATEEEIKKAYRKLVSVYHPDIHQGANQNYYEEKMKEVNAAYEMAISNLRKTKNTTYYSQTGYQYYTQRNYQAYTSHNNHNSTYQRPNQNGPYSLSLENCVAFLNIILYYDAVNTTYNALSKANEPLKNKNYLNRICEALKEYTKRVEPYLKYRKKYFNLSYDEYKMLTEYIQKMQNVTANFLNYLKKTAIKVSKEELFPVIKCTEPYSLFEKQVNFDSKIEQLLANLSFFCPLFAGSSDVLYEANPRCKDYADKEYLDKKASDFYSLTKFTFGDKMALNITARPHAFDDFVAAKEKEDGRGRSFKL